MPSDAETEAREWAPFVLEGVEFVPNLSRPSTEGSLTLAKPKALLDQYLALIEAFPHPRIVELGIFQGGSVALLALLSQPEKLVALELDPTPIDPLLQLIAERGLGESIRPYFGVDQGDRERLVEIMDDEFPDTDVDLVIDDASHLYAPSRSSFDVLFPRVRPGGVYVIEDWTWEDQWSKALARALEDGAEAPGAVEDQISGALADREGVRRPISALGLELTLAQAQSPDAIVEVVLNQRWITVRRGSQALDPDTFRLDHLYRDFYGELTRPAEAG